MTNRDEVQDPTMVFERHSVPPQYCAEWQKQIARSGVGSLKLLSNRSGSRVSVAHQHPRVAVTTD